MAYTTNDYSSVDLEEKGKSYFTDAPSVEEIFSAELAFYFRVVLTICLSGCVSIVGIMTNIVNIIVFVRQGIFTSSGSASLLGLAVSDLCCVTSMLWMSASYAIVHADLPSVSWLSVDALPLTADLPHYMFAQIARGVTAYVAIERCVCVVYPFKVKTLFTPKRSIIITVSIFVCCGLVISPLFITHQLQLRMDPATNTSRLAFIQAPNVVMHIMIIVHSFGLNFVAVMIVFVCTMITVFRLKLSKTWRNSLPSASSPRPQTQQPGTSTTLDRSLDSHRRHIVSEIEPTSNSRTMSTPQMQKEKKLVRMIVTISLIFLICYIPELTFTVLSSVSPNLLTVSDTSLGSFVYPIGFFMETVSSSINIIVYYRMSSRYKKDLTRWLGLKVA